jgi:hypothetical protein
MVDDHSGKILRMKVSKNTFTTEGGDCRHPTRSAEHFCHGKRLKLPGLCHRPAGWGTTHAGAGRCKMHFGNSRNVSANGHQLLVEKRARMELSQVNYPAEAIENPLEELGKLAGEALRWKNILAAHVAELTTVRYSIANDDGGRSEQIRGEVQLYERSLADVGRLLVAIGRLNIDDRMVKIEERKADIVVRAIEAGLRAANVDQAHWERARLAAGAEIRRLTA